MEKSLVRFLRYQKSMGHSPKTRIHYEGSIRLFIEWCKANDYPTDIEDLRADAVREWLSFQRDKKLSDSTIATRTRALKAFTNWLYNEEWITKDPLARVKVPKESDKPKETFTPAQVDKLLSTCNRKNHNGLRDYAIILTLYSTGLRATELCELRISDVDHSRGLIVVRAGKGGKYRVLPLGEKVDRAIERYLAFREKTRDDVHSETWLFTNDEGEPMRMFGLRSMLVRRGSPIGIKANPHKFRHSFAVAYLRQGGKLETLKAVMGHSDFKITLHYARLAGVDISTAHEIADPAKGLKSK